MTPAQRRVAQVRAAQAAATAEAGQQLVGSAYELMLAKLATDKRRLHEVQSIERKIDIKREILPEYDEWVVSVLDSGRGGQDDVLTTVMIWNIDAGQYSQALDIAEYVLKHGLTLPDQYQRDVPTALVDEVSDAALAAQRQDQPMDLSLLLRLEAMTAGLDMPDQARARLHKAIGMGAKAAGDLPAAQRHLERALQLHSGAGCKRDLADVERLIKKQEAQA
ncbi:MAG: hypothetical protein GX772_12880 [Alcaligenaceae bacterium]|nr:hypothetical protein [Alcaligenaceae bacterium]